MPESESQAEACVAATLERFGALDILVNNAATNPHFGPVLEHRRGAGPTKTVQVNQLGVLAWTRAPGGRRWPNTAGQW